MRKWRTVSAFLIALIVFTMCPAGQVCPVLADDISVVDATDYTFIESVDEAFIGAEDDMEQLSVVGEVYEGTLEEYLAEYADEKDNPVVNLWLAKEQQNAVKRDNAVKGTTESNSDLKVLALPKLMSAGSGALTLNDGGTDYGYCQLDTLQKQLYDELKASAEALVNSEEFKTEDYTLTFGQIAAGISTGGTKMSEQSVYNTFLAFYYDNPQYYFIEGSLSYSTTSDSASVLLSVDPEYDRPEARNTANAAILSLATEWINTVKAQSFYTSTTLPKADKDYMTALMIHDLILERVEYTYDESGNPSDAKWAHSIAGVFTAQGAVCEAYARAFQYMLNLLGVENIYIVGTAGGGGHAWNVMGIDGRYFCVDITWDDALKKTDDVNQLQYWYYYFGQPAGIFAGTHRTSTSQGRGLDWLYDLPQLDNSYDFFYYSYVNAFFPAAFADDSEAANAAELALASQHGNFLQALFGMSDTGSMAGLERAADIKFDSRHYNQDGYSLCFVKRTASLSAPATSVMLSPAENAEVAVEESITFTASCMPEGTDEHVIWNVRVSGSDNPAITSELVSWTAEGDKLTLTGLENGNVTVVARTASNNCAATVNVKVGTGIWTPKTLIYKNGDKNHKSCIVKSERLTATNWYDAKGKIKSGKLVYVSRNDLNGIEFDLVKHTVKTKSDKTVASVSSKGVVTAKGPGTAYIYVVDTGTMDFDVFTVYVDAAPTKLTASAVPGSVEKNDVVKTAALPVGNTGRIYIVPTIKNMTVSENCTYKAELAKSEYAQYVEVSQPVKGADGSISICVTSLSNNITKAKPYTAKVVVTNIESGKKVTLSVVAYNPVNTVLASITEGTDLDTKNDVVKLGLIVNTPMGEDVKTTANLKVYVGKTSVTLDGKKVITDKGATVGTKLDKNYKELVLTAKKDAGATAVIGLLANESAVKEYRLYRIASVDADGHVVIEAR